MSEKLCPGCGKAIPPAEEALRFCPYCGHPLIAATGEAQKPSALAERLAKEPKPQKKYRIIQEALAASPDDFEANEALLYHGRLHEPMARSKGIDFSIIKAHLLSVFHTPEIYTQAQLDAKVEELLRGPQLQRTMALSDDPQTFFAGYLRRLAFDYVNLFIRGDSKNSSLAFGFNRSIESQARRCAGPVRKMLDTIQHSDRLDETERAILRSGVQEGFARIFPGHASLLQETQ